jgi:beta-phosphoglucomutase
MQIQAFIFDLDGVITDTSEFHYLGWKRLADEEGIPFTRADNENLRGVSRRESLKRMLNGRVISEEQAEAWMARKNRYYVDFIDKLTPANILPGARELLGELKAAGIQTAIASSSKNATLVVDRLQIAPLIDALVDGGMVSQSKPAPDLFLEAARRLGAEPARCVVVEDAEAGVKAGNAAGMLTLGLGPQERVGVATLTLPDLNGADLAALAQKMGFSIS